MVIGRLARVVTAVVITRLRLRRVAAVVAGVVRRGIVRVADRSFPMMPAAVVGRVAMQNAHPPRFDLAGVSILGHLARPRNRVPATLDGEGRHGSQPHSDRDPQCRQNLSHLLLPSIPCGLGGPRSTLSLAAPASGSQRAGGPRTAVPL
jgi:hypothetical protein